MPKSREARREFWRELIAQQQQTGVPVRAVCQQHGVSEYSFYQWRKRLAEQLPVKFALVETSHAAPVQAATVEVILISGERLLIPPARGRRYAASGLEHIARATMIHLPASVRVCLATTPCDMRRSFDGLHALVNASVSRYCL